MARTSWYLTQTVSFIGKRPRLDADGKPVRDSRGNDIYDQVPFDVENCAWEPRQSLGSENVDAAQQVVSGLALYCADPDVDVRATDAAMVDGLRYEVKGEVARHRGSRLGNDHAAMVLERVTG